MYLKAVETLGGVDGVTAAVVPTGPGSSVDGQTVVVLIPDGETVNSTSVQVVRDVTGQTARARRFPRAGDQSFWGIGIPSALMSLSGIPKQDTDLSRWMERLFGTAGFPWWWHTREDTIDKIDADVLALDTRVYVAAALRLVGAPVLQRLRVFGRGVVPELIGRVLVEDPHHPWQKAVGPVSPHLSFMLPLAVLGVQRVEHGMLFDQLPHLALRELIGVGEQLAGIARQMNQCSDLQNMRIPLKRGPTWREMMISPPGCSRVINRVAKAV
jgi:hypothetical protein